MPASHGIDFHPDFQRTSQVDWNATEAYPLMAVKATEGAHVGTYEARSGRDFLKLRERRHQGLHQFTMLYFWIIGGKPVVDQVANFERFVKKYIGAFEPGEGYQLDYEVISYSPTPTSDMAWEFIERAYDRLDREGITYCSDWMPDSPLDHDNRGEFYEWREQHPTAPLWYANYSLSTGPTGGTAEVRKFDADIWQWTSVARVPGWPTGVDMNEIQPKGWDTLRRICKVHTDTPVPAFPDFPSEEDDMKELLTRERWLGYHNVFLCGPGFARPLSPDSNEYWRNAGVPEILHDQEQHRQSLRSTLRLAGLDGNDLVGDGTGDWYHD